MKGEINRSVTVSQSLTWGDLVFSSPAKTKSILRLHGLMWQCVTPYGKISTLPFFAQSSRPIITSAQIMDFYYCCNWSLANHRISSWFSWTKRQLRVKPKLSLVNAFYLLKKKPRTIQRQLFCGTVEEKSVTVEHCRFFVVDLAVLRNFTLGKNKAVDTAVYLSLTMKWGIPLRTRFRCMIN